MSLFLLYFDGGPLRSLEGVRGRIFFEELRCTVTSGGALVASQQLSICHNWSSGPFRFSFDPALGFDAKLHPELLDLIARRLDEGLEPHMFFHWFEASENVLEVQRGADVRIVDAAHLFKTLHQIPLETVVRITGVGDSARIPVTDLIARRIGGGEVPQLPLFDGILFGDGTIALMQCRVDSEEPEDRPELRLVVHSTLERFLEHNPNRWMSMPASASCCCDAQGISLTCGGSSAETGGFVMVRGLDDGALRWVASFENYGPFKEIGWENGAVVATTSRGHRVVFPLDRPEHAWVKEDKS